MRRSVFIDDDVAAYLSDAVIDEPEYLTALRAETATMRGANMQIGVDQGRFMQVLTELMGARRALEIGVYTGYSSICLASSLGPEGKLVACDISEEWTQVARRYWQRAGLEGRVELRLGPALDTLDELIAADVEAFDLAFIDADKGGYADYYERCLRLVRPGGLILFDNALWDGRVAAAPGSPSDDADTEHLRRLNARVMADGRVHASLIPVGDGLLLARRRA